MAIEVQVPLRSDREASTRPRALLGESVSFDSDPGQNVSWRPVDGIPAGRAWLLQSIYAHNAEPKPVLGMFVLLDHERTDHARWTAGPTAPAEVGPDQALCWTGLLWVPPGWRVGIKFLDMTGGAYCHWRYTAIELA